MPFLFKGWGEWADYPQFGADGWERIEYKDGIIKGRVFQDEKPMFGGRSFISSYCFSEQGEYRAVGPCMVRVGKKAAGRLLDGKEWNEFPDQPRAKSATDPQLKH